MPGIRREAREFDSLSGVKTPLALSVLVLALAPALPLQLGATRRGALVPRHAAAPAGALRGPSRRARGEPRGGARRLESRPERGELDLGRTPARLPGALPRGGRLVHRGTRDVSREPPPAAPPRPPLHHAAAPRPGCRRPDARRRARRGRARRVGAGRRAQPLRHPAQHAADERLLPPGPRALPERSLRGGAGGVRALPRLRGRDPRHVGGDGALDVHDAAPPRPVRRGPRARRRRAPGHGRDRELRLLPPASDVRGPAPAVAADPRPRGRGASRTRRCSTASRTGRRPTATRRARGGCCRSSWTARAGPRSGYIAAEVDISRR